MSATISSIRKANKRGDRIIIDFEPAREPVELSTEVAASFSNIATGIIVDDAAIEKWLRADELARCRQKAWALLAHRPRSRMELERALRQRKFSPAAIQEVITVLEEKKFINDEAFARQYVEEVAGTKKAGPRLVRQQLAVRGIKGTIADQAIAPVESAEVQRQSARTLLVKWNRRKKPEEMAKRRQLAAAFLMRKGFDGDVVWEAVREVLGSPHDE